MCDSKQLSAKVYQFEGFSFYHGLEEPNSWQNHGHEEIQITLPQSNARAWMQSQSATGKRSDRQINIGEAYLVSQHQIHQLHWQNTAELTLFYLHPRFLAAAIDLSLESSQIEVCDRFSLVKDTLIREVGEIFRHLCGLNLATEPLYLENLANLLAVHLLKNYLNYDLKVSALDRGLSYRQLKRVFDYIEANLDKKITLTDLAETAGLGKFYFCRLFKNSLHLTPYQYVIQQRVEKAKNLLQYSNTSICDVALDCGFSSQSHLAKHFRNFVKISPMNYRQSTR